MPPSKHGVLWTVAALATALAGVAPAAARSDTGPATPTPHHDGPFVWADPPPAVPPASAPSAARPRQAARVADPLALHSLAGSAHTVFIDFNGHVVSGTAWNDQGVASGPTPGWDPAGNGAAVLSASEQAAVVEVWTRVAEDFAPFDVDVTTADPGADALTRTGPADPTYGVRVLVSTDPAARSAIDGCAGTCSGVAFNDVFDTPVEHARHQIAWVFPQALVDDAKFVAETVSHEVGHTLGLDHDDRSGDADAGYYSGHTPWAPIMGSAHAQPVSQWSRGSFAGSLNPEDDLAIIASSGIPLRADEGSTLPAPGVTSYITSAADLDTYVLEDCAGAVQVDADVATVGADLDVELRLLTSDNALLAQADPLSAASERTATGLDALLSHTVDATPRDYRLVVDGTGRDGTTPTTGYDDYGSVGAYRLSVSGCGIADGAPGAPGVPTVTFAGTTAQVSWTAPAVSGDSPVTSYDVSVDGAVRTRVSSTQAAVAGLVRGRSYDFSVAAVNAQGVGLAATRTASVPVAKPGAPRIGRATSGAPGGTVTAAVAWSPPVSNGGAAVSAYQLTVYRLDRRGRVVSTVTSGTLSGTIGRAEVRFTRAGTYRFAVRARNVAGWGPLSARSTAVLGR